MYNMKRPLSSTKAKSERTYSGISISERIAFRKAQFVEVGIELFGTIGYQATTMRLLTAKTGLTNRYFYESFSNLEDLLVASYEKLMDDFRTRLQLVLTDANEQTDPALRIRPGLVCFFEAMKNPKFARITHTEVLGVSERVDRLYSRNTADFASLMMEHLTSSISHPLLLSNTQMQYIGAALTGSLINSAMVWVNSKYEISIEEIVDVTLNVFVGTVSQFTGAKA